MRIRSWISDESGNGFEAEVNVENTDTYQYKLLTIALEALNRIGFSIGELQEDQ